jgi:hypothetical protein
MSDYLELTDSDSGEVIARLLPDRIIFTRASDFQALLRMERATRVPEGVSLPIDGGHATAAAAAVKTGATRTAGHAHHHDPHVHDKTSDTGAANQQTVRHVLNMHPDLAAHMAAEPSVHDPDVKVGRLERFSQTYLSDMHEAVHEHPPA